MTILCYVSIWKGLSFYTISSQQGYRLLSLTESYLRNLDLFWVMSIALYSTQHRQKQTFVLKQLSPNSHISRNSVDTHVTNLALEWKLQKGMCIPTQHLWQHLTHSRCLIFQSHMDISRPSTSRIPFWTSNSPLDGYPDSSLATLQCRP